MAAHTTTQTIKHLNSIFSKNRAFYKQILLHVFDSFFHTEQDTVIQSIKTNKWQQYHGYQGTPARLSANNGLTGAFRKPACSSTQSACYLSPGRVKERKGRSTDKELCPSPCIIASCRRKIYVVCSLGFLAHCPALSESLLPRCEHPSGR